MQLSVARLDGSNATVATVRGEVDISAAHHLCNELLGALQHQTLQLLVDLSGVTFMDASAVNVMLLVARSSSDRGIGLMLVAVPAHVRRILTALNLEHALPHTDTLQAALAPPDGSSSDADPTRP